MKWKGYICPKCSLGIQHDGDWNIICPNCDTLINIKTARKIKEVE